MSSAENTPTTVDRNDIPQREAGTQRPARPPRTARLVGVDLARFLAVVGMVFAVLCGVSVTLAYRKYLEAGDILAAQIALLTRGALLVLIGLVLTIPLQLAAIVLVYLGVAMWLSVPFLRVRGWVVALVAGLLTMIVPPVNWLVRQQLQLAGPQPMEQGTAVDLSRGTMSLFDVAAHPVEAVRDVLLTGTYPVSTWLVYLLVGILIGRALLSAVATGRGKRFAAILAGGGAALAAFSIAVSWCVYYGFARAQQIQALGSETFSATGLTVDEIILGSSQGGPSGAWSSLLLDAPHSGTVLDVTRGVGIAGAIIGLCLLACWALPRIPWALRPVLAAGAAVDRVLHPHPPQRRPVPPGRRCHRPDFRQRAGTPQSVAGVGRAEHSSRCHPRGRDTAGSAPEERTVGSARRRQRDSCRSPGTAPRRPASAGIALSRAPPRAGAAPTTPG
ncbi:hypothetical protein [Leifsonia xyli]|uniref:hypothetical protein n=1 Tax=Leifsonia xyli TaxID=1575 RepID=UPI00083CA4F7|nr:hypothetical protein [Leifsonia xyli]